jgi:hypothetical protein
MEPEYRREKGVGDIPNRYTSDVVLNQQARVAHQGGMADSPYRAAQLLKIARRCWTQALMADPETVPWRATSGELMADPDDGPWRVTL